MMKLVVGLVSLYKVTTDSLSKFALATEYKTRLKYAYVAGIFVRIFMRTAEDAAVVSDAEKTTITKNLPNSVAITDAINSRVMQKAVAETVNVTDNLDGSATAEDEQTAQLFKATTDTASILDTEVIVLSKPLANSGNVADTEAVLLSKPAADAANVTDVEAILVAKPLANSGSVTDTGLISFPDYADPAYFSEQYVVDYRTF